MRRSTSRPSSASSPRCLGGELPFEWIVDNTRWKRRTTTYTDTEHAMRSLATRYRRDLWHDAKAYVEVWVEKDALAGTFADITEKSDVPLMVAKGYSSISFLKAAAEDIEEYWSDRPAYIYLFGDHDPSGVDARRNTRERLEEFAPACDITFESPAHGGADQRMEPPDAAHKAE
jgi:hypothetical protein